MLNFAPFSVLVLARTLLLMTTDDDNEKMREEVALRNM
jgi:hypothetical protein